MCCGEEREREEERRGQVVGEREEEQIRVSLGGKEMVVNGRHGFVRSVCSL